MKRIGDLSGMRVLVLLLVFLAGYTADVTAQETDDAASIELPQPEEFLPLAVGNSWTYDYLYEADEGSLEIVTIEITHTEEIDGHRYFVFSAMPYDWPPVPYFFLAGKKVRFAADGRLMERRAEGETFLFHFGLEHNETYALAESEPDTVVSANTFITSSQGRKSFSLWGDYSFFESEIRDDTAKRFFEPFQPEFRSASFILGLGLYEFYISIKNEDYPVLLSRLFLQYAIINGQRLRYDARLGPTSVAPTSWGRLKRLFNPY